MNDSHLHWQQGHFSHPKKKALIIGAGEQHVRQEEMSGCSRRHRAGPGGLATLRVGVGPAQVSLPGWQEWVWELVLLSPNSSVGNFPLLEKPPSHHPSAFLKCLTVLRAW